MIETDAVRDLEMIRGIQGDALVALAERDRPQHFQVAARRGQSLDPRLVHNQVDERRRAAIHNRHFRRVQLDDRVVDAERRERRQQMLDGLDGDCLARQARGVLNPPQMRDGGRDFEAPQIRTLKPDPVIRGGGLE